MGTSRSHYFRSLFEVDLKGLCPQDISPIPPYALKLSYPPGLESPRLERKAALLNSSAEETILGAGSTGEERNLHPYPVKWMV